MVKSSRLYRRNKPKRKIGTHKVTAGSRKLTGRRIMSKSRYRTRRKLTEAGIRKAMVFKDLLNAAGRVGGDREAVLQRKNTDILAELLKEHKFLLL